MKAFLIRLKLLPVFLTLFLSSCIFEDESVCNNDLTFDLAYILNKDNTDYFGKQVQFVQTFIYSEDGQLQKQIITSPANHLIRVADLPSGNYTAVFWCNNDTSHYSLLNLQSLSAMQLKYNTLNGQITDYRGSLFHGIKKFQFYRAHSSTEKVFLTKNTNDVRIIIEQPGDGLTVELQGANTSFKSDNSLAVSQPAIRYNPFQTLVDGPSASTFRFTSLRLLMESEVYIHVYRYGRLIHTFPLIQLLMQNSPLIRTNEDLDRYDEYELRFRVNPNNTTTLATIRINDWIRVLQNGGLE